MISFFFKRQKIVLDCFTTNINSFDYFPIDKASNFYPDWWKSYPKSYPDINEQGIKVERSTIKRCDGLIDLYQQGFMIPLWSDLILETHPNGFKYTFADGNSVVEDHDYNQMSNEFIQYIHFKLRSPWKIRDKKGTKFAFVQPSYNHVKTLTNWHVLPGVIDFKYQHATNINFVAGRGQRFEIKAGHPLAHVIPLSDKEIEIKCHVVDPLNSEHQQILNNHYPFFNGSHKKIKKIINEQENKVCPFWGKK
jgi:hypothetical protein